MTPLFPTGPGKISVEDRFDTAPPSVVEYPILSTENPMLQLRPETPDLWDSILPEELRKLPEELARVDILLQDERLMEPFSARLP